MEGTRGNIKVLIKTCYYIIIKKQDQKVLKRL